MMASCYSSKGADYLRDGKYEQAIACLKRALEYDPNHKYAREYLNRAYAKVNLR